MVQEAAPIGGFPSGALAFKAHDAGQPQHQVLQIGYHYQYTDRYGQKGKQALLTRIKSLFAMEPLM
jgi:hypothetical protein